jgi:glycosyltransferase involved in cell wall biosynthesis
MTSNLTIVIPAYNEEHSLPELRRFIPSDFNVVLYDNFSSDSTANLALSYGWEVYKFKNCGFAEDPALVSLYLSRLATDWIYICRADEFPSAALIDHLYTLDSLDFDALRIPRHNILNGSKCTAWGVDYETPIFKASMFKVGGNKVRIGYPGIFSGATRFKTFSPSSSVYINHHQDYTVTSFVNAINRYSTNTLVGLLEANSIPKSPEDATLLFYLRKLRYHVYNRSSLLVFALFTAPLLRFCWHYIYRKGFLSGYTGFIASLMMFLDELLIILKALSLKISWKL